MSKLFPLKGGCAIGAHSVSVPYATMAADADRIRMTFKAGSYSFPSQLVDKIAPFPGLHMQGIEIVHSSPDLPRPAIFWTFSPDMVMNELRALGYKVENPAQ